MKYNTAKPKKGNPYYLYDGTGKNIILLVEEQWEGTCIDDIHLFDDITVLETFIDNNPIGRNEWYLVKYIDVKPQ